MISKIHWSQQKSDITTEEMRVILTIILFMLLFIIIFEIVKIERMRHQKMPAVRKARRGFGDQRVEIVR